MLCFPIIMRICIQNRLNMKDNVVKINNKTKGEIKIVNDLKSLSGMVVVAWSLVRVDAAKRAKFRKCGQVFCFKSEVQ